MTQLRLKTDRTGHDDHQTERARFKRAELRARLAAERAELLSSLLGLDAATLEGRPVVGTTTATDMLGQIAAQDSLFTTHIRHALDLPAPRQPVDEASDGAVSTGSRFEKAVRRCVAARKTFLDTVALVPDERLASQESGGDSGNSLISLVIQSYWNDASYSLRLNTWSRDEGLGMATGPAVVLLAAVRAARKELLTTVALLPVAKRAQMLTGSLAAVSDLERQFLDALARSRETSLTGTEEETEGAGSGSAAGTWKRVWSDLHATHAHLLGTLEALHEDRFEQTIIGPMGAPDSVYMWTRGCLLHDRIQASAIRATLALDWPQRLLR